MKVTILDYSTLTPHLYNLTTEQVDRLEWNDPTENENVIIQLGHNPQDCRWMFHY